MKYKLLIALAVQRTIYNILIHRAGVENYSAPMVLLLIDAIHFSISLAMVTLIGWDSSSGGNWKIMLFPAILSFFKNNFLFFGMMYLDPSLYQMVYQINIVFASLITPKELSIRQRVSIFLLFFGICIILYNRDDAIHLPQHKHSLGIVITILGAAASASSDQAFEDIVKQEYNSTWVRQMQMSALGCVGAVISCIQDYEDIRDSDPITAPTFVLVIIKCAGDIIIPFVLKYADNVIKGFSDTLAVLLAFVISQILYHWHPHLEFWIGLILIVTAAVMFNHEKEKPKSKILTV